MLTAEGRETDRAGTGPGEDHQPVLLYEGFHDTAIVQLDLDGRVRAWSSGAEHMLGATNGRSLAHRALLFGAAEGAAGRLRRALQAAAANGRCRVLGWRTRRDGSRFWAQVLIRPLRDDGRSAVGFLAVVQDLTSCRRRVHRLRAAIELSQAILSDAPFEQVVRLVARRARAFVPSDGAQVVVREQGSDAGPVSVAVGWSARLLRDGVIDDASRAPLALAPGAGSARPGPVLSVALGGERRGMGTLVVYNRAGGQPFCRQDLVDLRGFAADAALALHHYRARDDRRRLVAVERAQLWQVFQSGTIQSLDRLARELADAAGEAAHRCRDRAMEQQLASCATTVEGVIQDVRNHVLGLGPSILDGRGLDDALRVLARDVELRSGVATFVEMEAEAAERLTARAGDVVQLVREALSNAERHARARSCRLRLRAGDGKALLDIEDDGIGFALDRVGGNGHGLSSLQERVARMGGRLQIESAPRAGTALRIAIPY